MDTEEVRERLRAVVASRAGVGTRAKFDAAFRAEAVAYVRARRKEGISQEAAAAELGMSSWTVSRWHQRRGASCEALGGSSEGGGGFHAVAVRPESPRASTAAAGLTVVAPGGVRVEGLSLQQVAQLLKGLA